MIRLNVNLIPFGEEAKARDIAKLVLWNTAIYSSKTGKHKYYGCFYDDTGLMTKLVSVWHTREDGLWVLVDKLIKTTNEKDFNSLPTKTLNKLRAYEGI